MKYVCCPVKGSCTDYRYNNCNGCAVGEKMVKQKKQITRLKEENMKLKAKHNGGEWIVDEYDTTDQIPSYAFISFHCSECNTDFELEEGQYGWCGDEIPLKYCAICGAVMESAHAFQKYAETRGNLDDMF